MDYFERTTTRWGQITILITLVLSVLGPVWVLMHPSVNVTAGQLLTAFGLVASTFGIIWIIEPLTYYSILGRPAMYQAFMIGNISSKLLPAAMIAQHRLNAKPGTKKGEITASLAICGAAFIHLASLTVFVGVLGTWLLKIVPKDVVTVTGTYVLPAVLGAVLVQAIASLKAYKLTAVAFTCAAVLVMAFTFLAPKLMPMATALCVVVCILIAWKFHRQLAPAVEPSEPLPGVVPGATPGDDIV